MLTFAVETSCDETSVCIIDENRNIHSHIIYSQEEHNKFGGVIPELASRSHLEILQKISKESLISSNLAIEDIDVFCATCGPGLVGGLLVGSIFTKSMALELNKPFIPINHLEGHLLSTTYNNDVNYPHVVFLLTGGHTQIYLVKSINSYELLGETLDDAIGEAFDKVAKLIGLNYPGGPEIEKKAKNGNPDKFKLPHPLENKKDLNFSFSGIKTAVNIIVKNQSVINSSFKCDISSSFQKTIGNILKKKLELTIKYLLRKNIKILTISLVGGVANNDYIYNSMKHIAEKNSLKVIMPPKFMLSDNAAMIGWAAIQKIKIDKNNSSDLLFKVNPRLKIADTTK